MSAMVELYMAGRLKAGDELEPVPDILPVELQRRLVEFRATIINPENQRRSITWKGKAQSLKKMRECLESEHRAKGLWGEHRNFRLVGHTKSLREEADELK